MDGAIVPIVYTTEVVDLLEEEGVSPSRTPARRWGTTEDLEGIAVYLASCASNDHTGDSLRVDGGYSIFNSL